MKKLVTYALLLSIVLSLLICGVGAASATSISQQTSADALNKLGLFNGVGQNADGTPDYALSKAADRQTATTMLVRIIGKEKEATSEKSTCVFNDVSSWAKSTVAWAYDRGYVNGYDGNSFGGTDQITAQQYICMVLRAMGYTDSGDDPDFTYNTACAFAASIGLTDGSYTNKTKNFTRGDIATISYSAINSKVKDSDSSLYEACFSQIDDLKFSVQLNKNKLAKTDYTNSAPGTLTAVSSDKSTVIDYSNSSLGYVMVKTTQSGSPKLVVMITCPNGTTYKYYYTSSAGVYEAFPLTEGSGTYKIGVYKNTSGTKYSTLYSTSISVKITDELSPFLRPNYFVDYTSDTDAVKYAAKLCDGITDELEKVEKVYDYVIGNFTYDYDKAASVETGYRPVLDTVFKSKIGICFDYSAVMASMLRSQGVPTKLVVGYAGTTYHAWISVYTKESGWIEAVIYFDGSTWKLMDPTFASTGNSSASIMEFINNTKNYTAKYVY
jgi:hypothetical protein